MIYLFVSIIFTAFIYVIFRAFVQYGVDPLPAIVFNYVSRVFIGLIIDPESFTTYIHNAPPPLLLLCIGTGVCFIMIFSLVSQATRTLGITATTIISRMSMVIPAGFSILYYGENLGWMKFCGIILALIAIFFTVYKKKEKEEAPGAPVTAMGKLGIVLPILIFLGSGVADTFIKIAQTEYMPKKLDFVYIDILYSVSALTGIIALLVNRTPVKTMFRKVNLLWGFILGAVNYIALLLFLLALTKGGLQGSKVFPINSVGIVLFSALFALMFYKEKLNARKIFGLLLAVGAILLISWS
jgi:drug/metabolite transporter (DMT)-like permease